MGHLDRNFSQNVLLRYGIVSQEIVLILVSSINLNPHHNLLTFCLLFTDPYLFPACVVCSWSFLCLYVGTVYVVMGFASVSAVIRPDCPAVMCSYYVLLSIFANVK